MYRSVRDMHCGPANRWRTNAIVRPSGDHAGASSRDTHPRGAPSPHRRHPPDTTAVKTGDPHRTASDERQVAPIRRPRSPWLLTDPDHLAPTDAVEVRHPNAVPLLKEQRRPSGDPRNPRTPVNASIVLRTTPPGETKCRDDDEKPRCEKTTKSPFSPGKPPHPPLAPTARAPPQDPPHRATAAGPTSHTPSTRRTPQTLPPYAQHAGRASVPSPDAGRGQTTDAKRPRNPHAKRGGFTSRSRRSEKRTLPDCREIDGRLRKPVGVMVVFSCMSSRRTTSTMLSRACSVALAFSVVALLTSVPLCGAAGASPPPVRYTQIAVGPQFSCALRSDRKAVCWGRGLILNPTPPKGRYTEISAGVRSRLRADNNGSRRVLGHQHQWSDQRARRTLPAYFSWLQHVVRPCLDREDCVLGGRLRPRRRDTARQVHADFQRRAGPPCLCTDT